VSAAAWRALFGALRSNPVLAIFLLVPTLVTDNWATYALRPGPRPIIIGSICFMFALGWPAALSVLPSFRQMLLLPLAAREAGAVLLLLRVALPSLCVLLALAARFAIASYQGAPLPDPTDLAALLLGPCAAFPLMTLVPFLPLPDTAWRTTNAYPLTGQGPLAARVAACMAIFLAAPAIAVLPFLAPHRALAIALIVQAPIGLALLALAWRARQSTVLASFLSDQPGRAASVPVLRRPWLVRSRLLWPGLAIAVALSLLVPPLVRDSLSQQPMAVAIVAYTGCCLAFSQLIPLQQTVRVLRQLPIGAGSLAATLIVALIMPALLALLLSLALLAITRDHLQLPVGHTVTLWLFGIAVLITIVAPAIRFARRRVTALLWLPAAAVNWLAIFVLRHDHLVPDPWLLLASALLIGGSYVWLTHTLRNNIIRAALLV
jgi:hypothetical protein